MTSDALRWKRIDDAGFDPRQTTGDLAAETEASSVASPRPPESPVPGDEARHERRMREQAVDLADLLDRTAARDRSAFAALYRASSAKLYGVILRILARRSLADEALQDVYARIWERAADFDAAKGSPIAWMAAIARNRALDEIRRAKAVPVTEMPEGFDVATEAESPLEAMEQSDRLKALLGCLALLDGEKREVVLLAYYRGCSREALSQRFGRPVPTIKTWLHRSLAQLRLCLER